METLNTAVKGLLRRRISRRALALASVLWLALMLLPLVLVSFYAHPTYDDFTHALPVARVWASTGSLWATVKAAVSETADTYRNWNGVFTAMFFSKLQPMVFSSRLFFLTPLLTLAGLCLSAGYFCHALFRRRLGADRAMGMIAYAWLMTLLLQFLPSVREVLFWHAGTPYVLSATALFAMLGMLLRLCGPVSAGGYVLRAFLLFLWGIVLGGCPYPLGLGGVLGFALLSGWRLIRRSPERWGSLAALAGIAAAFALSCAAPGVATRMDASSAQQGGESLMSPAAAIAQSLFKCFTTTGKWLPLQLAASALLLFPLLRPLLERAKARFAHPFWFSFFSFGVLAAAFAPPIYIMGLEGYLLERVLSSLHFLYGILFVLNLIYWMGFWLRRGALAKAPDALLKADGLSAGRIALCAALLVWGVASTAVSNTLGASAAAAKSLITGEAAQYHQEMLLREEGIATGESAEAANAAVVPLGSVPTVFPRDRLPYSAGGGRSLIPLMRRYYRMERLAEAYGPGRIPPEEWERMESLLAQ